MICVRQNPSKNSLSALENSSAIYVVLYY